MSENHRSSMSLKRLSLPLVLTMLLASACQMENLMPSSKAKEEPPAEKVTQLKVKPGPKMKVTIYEFTSSVPEVSARAATDMFTNALVHSGAFAVVERQRLESGVEMEKSLQESGEATGQAGKGKLTGADYIFEGTVSEYAGTEQGRQVDVSMGGMESSRSNEARSLGLDVRIVNASTGEILDSVAVRKDLKASGSGVSGVGNMIRSVTGAGSALAPDVAYKKEQKEGVDKALRDCIDDAVYQLVKRYMSE